MKRQETLLLGGLLLPGWCGLLPGHGVGLHTKGLPWGITVHNMTTPHSNIPTLGGSKEGPGTNQRTQFCMKKSVGWLGVLGWNTGLPGEMKLVPTDTTPAVWRSLGPLGGGERNFMCRIMHAPRKLPLPQGPVLWAGEAPGELGMPSGREELYSFSPAVGYQRIWPFIVLLLTLLPNYLLGFFG